MANGLQKWIYNLKPRKPFSKERKPVGEVIPVYKREFTLKRNYSQKNQRLKAILNLGLVAIVCFFIGYFIYNVNQHYKDVSNKRKQFNKELEKNAFPVLYNTGKECMVKGDFIRAKSEFELALKIRPNDVNTNKYYVQTLIILCKNGDIDCRKVFNHIEESLKLLPNNSELYKLKSEYLFQIGDTLAAINEIQKIEQMDK